MSDVTVSDVKQPITSDHALRIARSDAEKAYRDLSGYRITILLQDDGWHVDYDVHDSKLKGGGAHYVIDAESGEILSQRYEQ